MLLIKYIEYIIHKIIFISSINNDKYDISVADFVLIIFIICGNFIKIPVMM